MLQENGNFIAAIPGSSQEREGAPRGALLCCFILVGGGVQVGIPAPRRSKVRSGQNALAGISSSAPLRLLSPRDPLRWARVGD